MLPLNVIKNVDVGPAFNGFIVRLLFSFLLSFKWGGVGFASFLSFYFVPGPPSQVKFAP